VWDDEESRSNEGGEGGRMNFNARLTLIKVEEGKERGKATEQRHHSTP